MKSVLSSEHVKKKSCCLPRSAESMGILHTEQKGC